MVLNESGTIGHFFVFDCAELVCDLNRSPSELAILLDPHKFACDTFFESLVYHHLPHIIVHHFY